MSMVAIGAGVAVTAAGTIGGALLSNAMTPSPPTPDTKGAKKGVNKAIAGYDKSIEEYLGQIKSIAGTISAPQVDWIGAAEEALDFNVKNNASFINLADSQSQAGTASLLRQQAQADPRFAEKRDQADTNNLAMMRGEVPLDVQRTLARSGAFQSLQGGFGGSGMDRNLRARDMGLTSLDMSQRGEANAQRWTSLLNDSFVKPAFVSPFQVMQFSGISSGQAINSAFQQGDMDFRAQLSGADMLATGAGNALNAQGNIFNVASGLPVQMMQADYQGAQNKWQAQAQQAQAMGQAVSSAAGTIGGGIAGMGYQGMMNPSSGMQNWGVDKQGADINSMRYGSLPSLMQAAPNAESFSYNPVRGWTPQALSI